MAIVMNKVLGFLILSLAVLGGINAANYTVLDDLGWTIPPAGNIAMRTWAESKSFDIGDTIVFKWNGTHDVAEVSQADYGNCTGTNPIGTVQTTSPYSVVLTSNATRYFICNVSNHCSLGQKVTISIGENAASSLTVGALSLFLSAMVLSFLNHY